MKKFITKLWTLWLALCMGSLSFLGVSFMVEIEAQPELRGKLEYIAIVILAGTFFAGRFLFQNRLQDALKKSVLKEKVQTYMAAILIYGALLESGSIFCTLAYMLTKTTWILGGSLASVAIMLILIPTAHKCQQDLELSQAEVESLAFENF